MARAALVLARVAVFGVVVLGASHALAAWPPNATAGGTYKVDPSEARMTIAELTLPDNFTLTIDPTINVIEWKVDKLSFGKNVTIDLSAPASPPPPSGASGASAQGQASWGQQGAAGGPGGWGGQGRSARAFAMRVASVVTAGTGDLWLKNDGGTGGAGGAGGKGQTGGGSSCGGGREPRTNAGPGGVGGTGGSGGPGGATSFVVIRIDSLPAGSADWQNTCAATCGGSARPPTATSNAGKIVIWGTPGCGGPGGPGGPGGSGDMSTPTRTCHTGIFTNVIVHGSQNGPSGANGSSGPPGFCMPGGRGAVIEGPLLPIVQAFPPTATARDQCAAGSSGGCSTYADDLLQTCTTFADPAQRASCQIRAERWRARGVTLDRAIAACNDTTGNLLECALVREQLRTALSPAACDSATGGGRF